jgi:GxxExxY protein
MLENQRLDQISHSIIGAAIEVHRHLGPGLLESAYESCLVFELKRLGLKVEVQKPLPVVYKDVKLDCGYRLDLVVEDEIIVEIKAIEKLLPIHEAQLLSYLRWRTRRLVC